MPHKLVSMLGMALWGLQLIRWQDRREKLILSDDLMDNIVEGQDNRSLMRVGVS